MVPDPFLCHTTQCGPRINAVPHTAMWSQSQLCATHLKVLHHNVVCPNTATHTNVVPSKILSYAPQCGPSHYIVLHTSMWSQTQRRATHISVIPATILCNTSQRGRSQNNTLPSTMWSQTPYCITHHFVAPDTALCYTTQCRPRPNIVLHTTIWSPIQHSYTTLCGPSPNTVLRTTM